MSTKPAIYLDANAGLAPLKEVQDGLPFLLRDLHNPSSTHQAGRAAASILREARSCVHEALLELLPGLLDKNWIWTSGGTEGLQASIRATVLGGKAKVWFYSPVEHSGVLGWLNQIPHHSYCRPIPLPIDENGRVDLPQFLKTYQETRDAGLLQAGDPFLFSLLWVNNETGVIQHQLKDLLEIVRQLGGYSLVDAAQAWGKLSQSEISHETIDWLATSGHKLGAFSGTGVLAFSKRARALLEKCPSYSGSQQMGLRAGTENLIGAWSLGVASKHRAWGHSQIKSLRDELELKIVSKIQGSKIQGKAVERVLNTINVSFESVPKSSLPLTDLLDLEGFSVSSGSACSSGVRRPSHVLKALGHSDELALATLRISLIPDQNPHDVTALFFPALQRAVERARKST